MPGTLVPYQRFLEIRQRRNHAAASPMEQPVQVVAGDVPDDRAVTLHGEATDEQCGTRSTMETRQMTKWKLLDDANTAPAR